MEISYKLIERHARDNGRKPEDVITQVKASYEYIAQFARPGQRPITVVLDNEVRK